MIDEPEMMCFGFGHDNSIGYVSHYNVLTEKEIFIGESLATIIGFVVIMIYMGLTLNLLKGGIK